ncbi:LOB domain-containing protein 38-like [Pyrus x bretschneideri]|uniref:LOB domain-containing protein 38-like n=1 Tax=Pyrus x bretschneideri TaxID=225117 RepID=UPI00202F6885|nr:LOB domain-containing protein 38-like [Pyrus x bretschneideri]
MSCNGCRVLRKGCSDNCILRQCLQWMEDPQAQAHATVFVAKFFGRAGLFSFINAVSESQRPALFQSLLFEAVGRTMNPVNGAMGLLLSGKWEVCQGAMETVLRGGALEPLPEYSRDIHYVREHQVREVQRQSTKRKRPNFDVNDNDDCVENFRSPDLNLSLTSATGLMSRTKRRDCRAATPSVEHSETTTLGSSSPENNCTAGNLERTKLLRLFI